MASAHDQTRDGRSEVRLNVRILATLRWYDGELGVVIDNLSSRGALIHGGDLPEQGTEVVLHFADSEIVATVAWFNPPACGLSFHRAVDAALLRERSRLSRGAAKRASGPLFERMSGPAREPK